MSEPEHRCAPWTQAHGIDPVGSAAPFERLVLVEVPFPWPPDVSHLPWLRALEPPPGTRVQTIVPETGRADGDVLMTSWERRAGAALVGTEWSVAAPDVPEVLDAIVAGRAVGGGGAAPSEVLICGHGARDRCCGGEGTRLVAEARAALADVRVRRTSHLGGHRFAPTALTLPDGRVWSHLDADLLDGIVHRTLHPHEARDHYRGNTALDGWAQVVESTLLTESGWDGFDLSALSATTEVDGHGDRADVELTWSGIAGEGTVERTVGVRRRYPVLACGLPPSQAPKTSPEYELLD